MANRFTATEKWVDPWFCELNEKDKLFWIYLLDNCDHAGIWQVNWPLVRFHIKDYVFNEKAFDGRITKLKENKWFIPKFITFQYKTGLNPENRAHSSVINILKKQGAYKGLTRGLQARKDMDKDKNKDKDKELSFFEEIWLKYPKRDGKKDAERHFKASVITSEDFVLINKALVNYLKTKTVKDGFIKNGSTWFNNWRDYIDYKDPIVNQKADEKPNPDCNVCDGTGKTKDKGGRCFCWSVR